MTYFRFLNLLSNTILRKSFVNIRNCVYCIMLLNLALILGYFLSILKFIYIAKSQFFVIEKRIEKLSKINIV